MTDNYDDIINLPHHVSAKYPQMSMQSRAAQFAPFAALTGHDAAIKEAARLTDTIQSSPDKLEALNMKFAWLRHHIAQRPMVKVIYFEPDDRKQGGKYASLQGNVKDIDEVYSVIVMTDGRAIPFDMLTDIQGDIFDSMSDM